MVSRLGLLATLVLLAAPLLPACAEGYASTPPNLPMGETPDAGSTCGNNVVDVASGEACDCPETATTMCLVRSETTTCMSLGMGTGQLACNPKTCQFITSLCSMGTKSTGGTGAASGGRGG